jgi:pre-mRNA-splicing factor CWC22
MSPITVSDKSKQNVSDLNAVSPSKAVHNHNVCIPPFKPVKPIQKVQDKTTPFYQINTWDSLRNSITRIINKVTTTNLVDIIRELLDLNLIRGRGIFCRSVLTSQMAYPEMSDVFSALVAVINSMFSDVGQLFVRRIVWQFKRAYKRNDKAQLINTVKFIAHLVNQKLADEIIAKEILTFLLENPSDDNVEVAIRFVIECGSMLQDVSPEVLSDVLVHFRVILYLGRIDKSVQFMIKKLFAIRKAKFQGYPAVRPELDLVEVKEDMLTHDVLLDEEIDPEFSLDVFKIDPYFEMNEKLYEWEKKVLMGDDEESEEDQESGSDVESDEDNESMQIKVSKSDSRSSHSSDSANSDESGRNRKRKL